MCISPLFSNNYIDGFSLRGGITISIDREIGSMNGMKVAKHDVVYLAGVQAMAFQLYKYFDLQCKSHLLARYLIYYIVHC